MKGLPRCPRKRCREILVERSGPFGALDFVCLPCELNDAGFCRSCRKPMAKAKKGRKLYCEPCRAARERDQDQQRYWHGEKRDQDIERQRKRRDDPAIYAGMREQMRQNYKSRAGTYDDFDRLYRRTYAKNRRAGAPRVTVDRRKQRTAA